MVEQPDHALRQSRLKMIGVMLVFALPLFIAMLVYYNPGWFSPPSAPHGFLLQPIRPLPEAFELNAYHAALESSTTVNGRELLTGHWTLLRLDDGRCSLACEADLFKMRQLRLSLGRDRERVRLVYLSSSEPRGAHWPDLLSRHPRLSVTSWSDKEPAYQKLFSDLTGSVYLLDPLGRLVLYYAELASAKDMLEDLKRLLKVSKIG